MHTHRAMPEIARKRLDVVGKAYREMLREGTDSRAICDDLVYALSRIDNPDLPTGAAWSARDIVRDCLRSRRSGAWEQKSN